MPTCPNGHESAATDYCDTCGVMIGEAPAPAPAATDPAGEAGEQAAAESAGETCPVCGAPRTAMFCEACGFNFATGSPTPAPEAASPPVPEPETPAPPAPSWTATVAADREYFDSVVAAGGPDAAAIEFPAYCPERKFVLAGSEMRIGRRSASRGLEPEIDLTGPPTDPGISHLHAVLSCESDGSWSVLDPGSSNGTQVNGADIATGVKVPVHDGDRIAIGGWTVVSIHSA